MEQIRSTLFASYNMCPHKAKIQKEVNLWTPVFDIGTIVHRVLAAVPSLLLEGKSWEPLFNTVVQEMDHCSMELVQRAKEAIRVGVQDIERALSEGYEIKTEVPMQKVLPCGITITGTADRVEQNSKVFRIIDYKIGFNVPTKQDMLGDLQLMVYAFLCQDQVKMSQTMEIGLFSLGRGITQCIEIPPDVECCIEDILDARAQKMAADTQFKPNPSTMCKYCDYMYECKFWESISKQIEIPGTIEEKVAILETVLSTMKGLQGVVDALKDDVVAQMVADGIEEVHIAGKDKRIVQTVRASGDGVSVSKPYIRL